MLYSDHPPNKQVSPLDAPLSRIAVCKQQLQAGALSLLLVVICQSAHLEVCEHRSCGSAEEAGMLSRGDVIEGCTDVGTEPARGDA
jgi:hypothetical protein